MCPQPELPPKKAVAMALLEGPSMLVHVDPRRAGVVVPPQFKRQAQLVLQIGLNLVIPIKDLLVDDDGISGTLSFNRSPFWCSLPWPAVYALVGEDGRGMVWPEDVPPELAVEAERKGAERQKAERGARKRKPRSPGEPVRPRVVKRTEAAESVEPAEPGEPAGALECVAPVEPAAPVEEPPPSALAPTELGEGEAGVTRLERPATEDEPAWAAGSEPTTSSPAEPPKGHKPPRKLPPYLRVIK
jgi:stringent starvation protein B